MSWTFQKHVAGSAGNGIDRDVEPTRGDTNAHREAAVPQSRASQRRPARGNRWKSATASDSAIAAAIAIEGVPRYRKGQGKTPY